MMKEKTLFIIMINKMKYLGMNLARTIQNLFKKCKTFPKDKK